jgi:hypothetical protein
MGWRADNPMTRVDYLRAALLECNETRMKIRVLRKIAQSIPVFLAGALVQTCKTLAGTYIYVFFIGFETAIPVKLYLREDSMGHNNPDKSYTAGRLIQPGTGLY